MATALVLVSCALVVCLWLLVFGRPSAAASPSTSSQREAERLRTLEADVERRRKEADEVKAACNELRAELKQVKRKLHEQRSTEKDEHDLVRARTDVERAASQQLEVVRGELAHALAELTKLRSDAETSRSRARGVPPPPSPVVVHAVAPPPPPAPVPTPVQTPVADASARRFRELSDSDREKLERFEHQANRERARALEFQAEVRRLKGRTETQHRVWVVTKGELDLLKDKFKALEKRLNRTLLERDLLKRAIGELERRGGLTAGRTELTAEEISASDQGVDERSRAEAERLERRTAAPPLPQEGNGKSEASPSPEAVAQEPATAPVEDSAS
jgi:chromosome segregation ATPase